MTEIQKLIKQVFTDYEYDDENFITTPHIENLEKILLQKVAQMQANPVENRVMLKIADDEKLKRLEKFNQEHLDMLSKIMLQLNILKENFEKDYQEILNIF